MYVIKDWSGEMMDWGEFETEELAYQEIEDRGEDDEYYAVRKEEDEEYELYFGD